MSRTEPRHPVTERQLAVLDLLVDEKSTAEIAETLSIARITVGHHVSALLARFGVRTRSALVARVLRRQRDEARAELAECMRFKRQFDRRGQRVSE